MKEGIYMAIPVFKYDEDLKQLYSEEGEVTVAVQGDDFGRCVQFEIPTVINDAESKATGNITSTSKVYLVWQNAHGDTGRKIAGASSDMLDSMAIQDGVCIVTFYLPDAFTAYAGKACLALEITDSDGRHGTRFAPVEVKVAQFVLDPFSKDLREGRIPDSLRAKAGAVTELYYDPVEKKLAASEELKKAFVKGDIMGRAINIILPRDLGGYGVVSETDELTIIYKNANGQTGEYLVPSRNMAFYDRRSWAMDHRDDGIDVCLIQFGIPAPLATYSGEAEIEIEIKKPGGQITHLSPVKLQVGEFFNQSDIEPDDPKYSIVEQLKSKVAYLSAKIDQIVTGDNEISLDSYLTKTEAASTYETQTNADLLLSKAGAASTYLTKADAASDYLKKADFVASNGTSPTVVNNLTSTSTTSALSANQGRILSERLRTPQTGWYQKILYDTNNLTCVYIRSWGKGPNAVVTGDISFGSSKPNTPGTTYTYNTGFKFQSATVAANVPFGRDGSGMAHVKIQFDGTITVRIVATSTATGGTIGDSTLYWALPVLVDTYPD